MNIEHLISKKELLTRYNISYGALYRWKRKGLIPDEWFIKKSTTTGQETFFHRGEICPRVELIMSRRDVSLEDLAKELQGAKPEAPARRLIIKGPYREQSYAIKELTAVKLVVDGKEYDLLDQLKGDHYGR